MMKSPKRPITPAPPSEDPKNDDSVMNVDAHLLNVVNTLANDETVPETNLDEDSEIPKMLMIFDNLKELMKGRQEELASLEEMGVMTAVKRTAEAR